MNQQEQLARQEALKALERIQGFDVQTLVREDELGSKKNFKGVLQPAQRLDDLYKKVTPVALEDFPADQLNTVKTRANADYQLFEQILKFDADSSTQQRDQLVQQVKSVYQQAFQALAPLISYSMHRATDFQRLESDARAAVQSINDRVSGLLKELQEAKRAAEEVVAGVREVAAETGVTQEAKYFREEAQNHSVKAGNWRSATFATAGVLMAYAAASLFFHRWSALRPEDTYAAVQLSIGKVLLAGVLSFLVYLSARNFLSHEHNAIVNKHRQNALLTYKTLVDAAKDSPNRDIVLTHASACIYSPQPTGYTAEPAGVPGVKSVVEMLTRPQQS